MAKRTVRDFAMTGDVWPRIGQWASARKYIFVREDATGRTYQRGVGFLTAPMMILLRSEAEQLHLEAWVRTPLINRIVTLFLMPAELDLQSGSAAAVIPRKMARGDVNALLTELQQPVIP